jgi:hypothetical protein
VVAVARIAFYWRVLFQARPTGQPTGRSTARILASIVAYDFFGSVALSWFAFAAGVLSADDVSAWITRFVLAWGMLAAFISLSHVFREYARGSMASEFAGITGERLGADGTDGITDVALETFAAAVASVAVSLAW